MMRQFRPNRRRYQQSDPQIGLVANKKGEI
jgi:hypothetical protein